MLVSAKLSFIFTIRIHKDGTIWPHTNRLFGPLFVLNRKSDTPQTNK